MKNRFAAPTRALALTLCLVLLAVSLAACGKTDPSQQVITDTASKVGITERMYCYWLSLYKTQFLQSYGYSADEPEMWDVEVGTDEAGNPQKLKEALQVNIIENLKHLVAAATVYKTEGQTLKKSDLDEIDKTISDMTTDMGGKSALDTELAKYNSDTTVLKNVLVMEQTYSALTDYLFNDETGTMKKTQAMVEEYYDGHKDEFVQIQHILINTNVEEDAQTEEIEPTTGDTAAQDAIDSLAGIEEDTTAAPEAPAETDDTASSASKKAEKEALIAEVEQKWRDGTPYSELTSYSEDTGAASYPEGYVFSKDEMIAEFSDAAFDMAVGEIRKVDSEYGTHIMKKIELTKDAFVKWYGDNLKGRWQMEDLDAKLKPVVDTLDIKEDILKSFDFAGVATMFADPALAQ